MCLCNYYFDTTKKPRLLELLHLNIWYSSRKLINFQRKICVSYLNFYSSKIYKKIYKRRYIDINYLQITYQIINVDLVKYIFECSLIYIWILCDLKYLFICTFLFCVNKIKFCTDIYIHYIKWIYSEIYITCYKERYVSMYTNI